MNPLPQGYTLMDLASVDHDTLWRAVDELAYQGDIAVSCPETATLHACLCDQSGHVVAAVWSDQISGVFDFHLAVSPAHRECGLGRWLLDTALQAYQQQRQRITDLPLRVYVIDRRVWHALLRRGLRVLADHRALHQGHFAVEMGLN